MNKAWLAGFIDGEGYIGITFQIKKETRQSAVSPRYHPFLIIANTNEEVLIYVKELINEGRTYILGKGLGKNKKSYQYKLTRMDTLLGVLKDILPYLRIKRMQCELLINFIERRKSIKPVTGRGSRGVTSFDDNDKEIYKRLLLLNKKGN